MDKFRSRELIPSAGLRGADGGGTTAGGAAWQIAGALTGTRVVNAPITLSGGTINGGLTLNGDVTSTGGSLGTTINGAISHSTGTLNVAGTVGGSGSFTATSGRSTARARSIAQ